MDNFNPNNSNPVPVASNSLFVTNPRLKTLLLILIGVLLLSGIGLAVFSYWQKIYREKLYYETEGGLPIHRNEKKSEANIKGWKTYRNEEYGFEFEIPEKVNIINAQFVYDSSKADWLAVSVDNIVKSGTSLEENELFKKDIELKNEALIIKHIRYNSTLPYDIKFQNSGILIIYGETQAANYAIAYKILNKSNDLITIRALNGYYGGLDDTIGSIKQSEAYKIMENIAGTFKFTK